MEAPWRGTAMGPPVSHRSAEGLKQRQKDQGKLMAEWLMGGIPVNLGGIEIGRGVAPCHQHPNLEKIIYSSQFFIFHNS